MQPYKKYLKTSIALFT